LLKSRLNEPLKNSKKHSGNAFFFPQKLSGNTHQFTSKTALLSLSFSVILSKSNNGSAIRMIAKFAMEGE
jgi:hypothetical protein